MIESFVKEVSQASIDAYFSEREYGKTLIWPLFFPPKQVGTLSYTSLIGSAGSPVAADVCAYNSSAPEKTRKVISRLTGDIPSIRVKKILDEKAILEYETLKALQIGGSKDDLLKMIFGDIDATQNGVYARFEWLCCKILSQGKVSLDKTNNAGTVTESAVDFQLPTANKELAAGANYYWTAGAYATNTPISNIETITEEARTAGVVIKHIVMSRPKWIAFKASTQVKDFGAQAIIPTGSTTPRVTLETVNNAMKDNGLPSIVVVDSQVTVETEAHAQTSGNPWVEKYVLFCPELPLGSMLHGPIAEEVVKPKQVIQSKKGPVLTSVWSELDPVSQITKSECNGFFSWPSIDRCWIMNTEHDSTF